jgi:hypothetical protein
MGRLFEPSPRNPTEMFSKASRLRLLKRINGIAWRHVKKALFVTLTYPDAYHDRSYAERTQDKYLIHRYAEKWVGKPVAALWRTEWKVRKSGYRAGQLAPHVHMVLFGVAFIPHAVVRAWWRTILGAVGPLATDVRAANNGLHAAKYIAKYVSKLDQGSLDIAAKVNNQPGRAWGFKRPQLIPWDTERWLVDVPTALVKQAQDTAAELYEGIDTTSPGGFTLFAATAGAIFNELRKLSMDMKTPEGYPIRYTEGDGAASQDVSRTD